MHIIDALRFTVPLVSSSKKQTLSRAPHVLPVQVRCMQPPTFAFLTLVKCHEVRIDF